MGRLGGVGWGARRVGDGAGVASADLRRRGRHEDHAFAMGCVGVAWVPSSVSSGVFASGLFGGSVLERLLVLVCARVAVDLAGSVFFHGDEVARTSGTSERTQHARTHTHSRGKMYIPAITPQYPPTAIRELAN